MMKVEIHPCERCGIQAEVDPKTEEHLCDRCRKLDGLSIEERVNLDANEEPWVHGTGVRPLRIASVS